MDKQHLAKGMRQIVYIFVVIALMVWGYYYYHHEKDYPSTSNAYIHGDIIFIASQVAGRLESVNVQNYQFVYQGEVLFQIDSALYQADLQKAQAAYQVATLENQAASSSILATRENVASATASLKQAQLNYNRTITLVKKGVLPQKHADDAQTALATTRANVAAAEDHMAALIAEQGISGVEAPAVQKAAAALLAASLNLSYTNISAPFDGELGRVNVHPGSVVNIGQALMPLVKADSFWVQANYKESDLGRIQPGMSATIRFDMYSDISYSGYVDNISPASGSAFSLLPPENASGNWVKVTQRFPVSIRLDKVSPERTSTHPLRIGASATVTINTVDKPTPIPVKTMASLDEQK